ncbi:type VII secretion protein EccCa [Mycobacterium kansasii]
MSTVRFVPGKRVAVPQVGAGKIPLEEPLAAPKPIPRTKMQIVLPAVIGVAFIGMIVLIFSQPALRTGTMGIFSLFFPVMMLMSFGGMMMMSRQGGEKNLTAAQMEVARRERLAELDEVREVVHEDAEKQFKQFQHLHPEPGLLRGLVGSPRMWERALTDPHFGWVRLGVGRADLVKRFDKPLLGKAADYEPVTYDALSAFLLEQTVVRGIAKPVSLARFPGLALIGEHGMEPVYALARAMICQVALFHSPRDLKVMVVTDDVSRWEWLKWLPHCRHSRLMDTGGQARMVWRSPEEMDAAVGIELHERKGFQPGAGLTHWLVFNDQARVNAVWETLTRKDGVAGVTFVRMVTENGAGVGFADETTLFVTDDMISTSRGPMAVPDALDEATARTIARKMARFRTDGYAAAPSSMIAETADLFDILGIEDPADIDVGRAWAATRTGPPWEEHPWGQEWLRIPIGVDEYGAPVALDFKETHQNGMGHHMVLVGTTGAGKSEFLTTLVLSACSTHSTDMLNIAFFDFKGSTTAHKIAGLPHVVAAMNNLRNDSLWIERMGDVIYGELERRKRMLDKARVSDAAEYEYLRIHCGEPLEPMPTLFVIIDEHTQMFIQHPPAKAVVDEIGRQGRALAVKLVLGSQRLGHEMQTGVMTNIPIRVALRTLDDVDSRAVLGTDDAKWLPMKPAGAGYLKVEGRKRLVRFQGAYVSKNYSPPRRAAADAVRAQVGYMPPRVFTAVGMEPLQQAALTPEVVESATPRTVLGPDGRPLRQVQVVTDSLRRQSADMRPVHRMWLPPLTPLPVDELVRRLRGRRWYEDYGVNKGLRFPVGVEDRPFQHSQRVYTIDMTGANCAVVGQGQSGKTTAIATMITGAALMYTPKRVQFYVIALSGPEVNAAANLPHVGSLARGSDPERVGRTIAEMLTLISERERAFSELKITVEEFRRRKFGGEPGPIPDDPFGDVFLVIDGWAQFYGSFEALVTDVVTIMDKGPAHGVHVIISAGGWISGKLTSAMGPLLTANVELKLSANDDLNRNKIAIAKAVPFGDREVLDGDDGDDDAAGGEERDTRVVKVRGRGTSMAGYHFQTGLPQLTVAGELVGVGEAAAMVADVAGTSQAAADVRMLPGHVSLDEVDELWRHRGGGRPGQVAFGISEIGLVPAVADFAAAPHLLLAGNPECGLSMGLATLARAVMRAYTPDRARIYVVDPRTSLLQVVEGAHLGRYTYREQQVREMAKEVAAILEGRLPPEDATQAELAAGGRWSGPQLFVFVDNEEAVQSMTSENIFAENGGYPLGPLIPYVDRAKEVGLHMVVARQIGTWGRAMGSPLVGRLLQLKAPGVVMDGDRSEGAIIGTVRASVQPPGRGVYVTDKLAAPVQIATVVRG